ncbi:molecular chaperone [Phyllobacterium sp. NPDC097923]|uniref:fimbrial biogenesis chaperone n=1 Tax=Phyllobacterium sp. NPDC097923 TaxID=3364404 RepID=UPI00383B70FB
MIFPRSAKLLFAIASFASILMFNLPALAAPLQVSPVSVDLTAPGQTSTVNLRNDGDRPVNVQVRVFSWSQVNGEDQLTPSRDVVASPPAATLQPGTTYTIRIARIAPPLKSGEETYRLLVDQLPEVNLRRPAASVDMVLRYSIPVFFAERAAGAELKWNISRSGKTLIAEATNVGNRHAKIAGLAVASKAGTVSFGEGLNGYVLPGSTRRWIVSAGAQRIQPGASVNVTAKGDDYAVNQTVVVTP